MVVLTPNHRRPPAPWWLQTLATQELSEDAAAMLRDVVDKSLDEIYGRAPLLLSDH